MKKPRTSKRSSGDRYFFSRPSRISQSGYRCRSLCFASSMSFASKTTLPTMLPDFVLILNTNRLCSPASAAEQGSRDRQAARNARTFHGDSSFSSASRGSRRSQLNCEPPLPQSA